MANYKQFRIFKDKSFANYGANWENIISLEGGVDICTKNWKVIVPLKLLIPKNYPSIAPYAAIGNVKDFHTTNVDYLLNSFLVKTPMIKNWNGEKMLGTYTLINVCDEIVAFFNTYPPLEMNNKDKNKNNAFKSMISSSTNLSTLDAILPMKLQNKDYIEINKPMDKFKEDSKEKNKEIKKV